MKNSMKIRMLRLAAMLLALSLLPMFALAEDTAANDNWVNFFLLCNEGMLNDGGNSGNTMMVVAMNPDSGKIRLMMLTWDTFIEYEGYDVLQKIDMPYRNNGPEETMKVFDANFDMGVDKFMSLNYLNLAQLIDAYGGVDVDVSRAERNALNGMVGSKKKAIQSQADSGLLSQMVVEMLAQEYYLNDYGPQTHLNGLQAVGFGWLQYDSVYNCCLRDVEVIAALFKSVGDKIGEEVAFYTDDADMPEVTDGRRAINLDAMTDEDIAFLRREVDPIFQMSYNNLTEDDILQIGAAVARTAYKASRQGVNIFDSEHLQYDVFPLEALQEYELVAGAYGHVVDYEKNSAAMKEFLFAED